MIGGNKPLPNVLFGRAEFKGEDAGGLGSEVFFNGGGEDFRHFFLKFLTIEQAFVFSVSDKSHLYQNRGDVRGF